MKLNNGSIELTYDESGELINILNDWLTQNFYDGDGTETAEDFVRLLERYRRDSFR